MGARVLLVVTHLLGAGHLTRTVALARAFARAGHEATLVSGGMPAPLISTAGVGFVQLPPVRTRGVAFRDLLDEAGEPVGADRLAARRDGLLATLAAVRPHAVVTELYPFGRRVLADEFAALVGEARRLRPRPLVLSSVRDILAAPAKPERAAEARRRLREGYDGVLVHGDPALVPLDASWPVDDAVRSLLRYTGYVDEGAAVEPAGSAERRGIVVSGGSSAAALALLRAAAGAAALLPDRPWRLLAGAGVGEADVAGLRAIAPPGATVERARPDFRALLARAELSVSQAGYNTAVDLLRAGPRALLVPFEAGRETEQRLRAECLHARGVAAVLPEEELSVAALAGAVERALAGPLPAASGVRLDGASETVAAVEELLGTPLSPLRRGEGERGSASAPLLDEALRRAEGTGVALDLWWRDDDAVAATPALERLLGLARRFQAPLALAAIPAAVEPSLPRRIAEAPDVAVLVHGLSHANHAPPDDKKAEFGPHRPPDAMGPDLAEGLRLAADAFGDRSLPVLVPPWNRIAPTLVPALPSLGYAGLSTFGPRRSSRPVPGLTEVNTHLDPIDWRGGRGLRDSAALDADLAAAVRSRVAGETVEPIGLLTHHLAHDEAVWSFCERLWERLCRSPAVRRPAARDLFAPGLPPVIKP